jgi:uncharacterized protein (DUF58 family)
MTAAARPAPPSTAEIAAAEALAAQLPALALAAERLARSLAPGRHGRRRAGTGEQFWQYRDVRQGDPRSAVDWRRSARGDRLYLREREWQIVATLALDIADDASMRWRSSPAVPEKWQHAALLGLATAQLALAGGERVTLLDRGRPVAGRGALDRLAANLALPAAAPRPARGRIALFGDFLDPPETIADRLRPLTAAARGGVLVQILDPAECDFPFHGRVLFEDVGASQAAQAEDIAKAESVAPAYRARIAAQREQVARIAREAGLIPIVHRTDAPAAPCLVAIRAALEPG